MSCKFGHVPLQIWIQRNPRSPPCGPFKSTVFAFRFLSGRGTARAEDAQGTPSQRHISPSILVYDEKIRNPSFSSQESDQHRFERAVRVGGKGAARADDAQGTPTQSRVTKYTSMRRKFTSRPPSSLRYLKAKARFWPCFFT